MQQQKTLPKQGFSLYTFFVFLPELQLKYFSMKRKRKESESNSI